MSDKPTVPSEGGSYVRQPDGSLDRKEFTRQPHEAEATEKPSTEKPAKVRKGG